MVVIRGQNYASQMLRRVAGDMRALQSSADIANANQAAVQSRIVQATQQRAQLERSIQTNAQNLSLARSSNATRAQIASNALNTRRNKITETQTKLLGNHAEKTTQIRQTTEAIAKNTTGSGYYSSLLAQSKLQGQALKIGEDTNAVLANREKLQGQLNTRLATQLDLQRKSLLAAEEQPLFSKNTSTKNLQRITSTGTIQDAALAHRVLANRQAIKDTQTAQALLVDEGPALQAIAQKTESLSIADQNRLAKLREQASSTANMNELLTKQKADLVRIDEQLAGIKKLTYGIGLDQRALNETNAKNLLDLNGQAAALERQKMQLTEINALIEVKLAKDLEDAGVLVGQAKQYDRIALAQRRASTVGAVGRVAQFGGLIGTAALGMAAYGYAKFTSSTTLAATQMAKIAGKGVEDVTAKAKLLNNTILDLMTKFPAKSADMATAAYNIFSSIPALTGPQGTQKGLALLQVANKASVAGGTDLITTTDALIKVMNNFGGAGQSVNSIMNRMFAIVRFGNMHFQEFTSMLNQIAPAALGAGQTLDNLAGVIADVTLHMSAPQGATGIARLLQIYATPAFVKGMASKGLAITVPGTEKLLPIIQILDKIAKIPGATAPGLIQQNLIKLVTAAGSPTGHGGTQGTQAARRVQSVFLSDLPTLHKLQKQAIADNSEFARSYAAMSQTTGIRWQVFMNMIKATMLKLGETVLPVFDKIIHRVSDLLKWFNNLSPGTRHMIGQFAAWGAIILLLGGTLMHLGGSILSVILKMQLMGGRTMLLRGGFMLVLAVVSALLFKLLPFQDAIKILSALIAGMAFSGIIAGISGIGIASAGASVEAATLNRQLIIMRASAALPIIFTVLVLEYRKKIASALDKSNFLGAASVDRFFAKHVPGARGLMENLFGKQQADATIGLSKQDQAMVASTKTMDQWLTKEGVAKSKWKNWYVDPKTGAYIMDPKKAKNQSPYDQFLNNSKAYETAAGKAAAASAKLTAQEKALLDSLNNTNTGLGSQASAATLAADRVNAVIAGQKKGAAEITKIVANLQTLFNNFQKSTEEMFGTLFQGPVMSGPIGQVYQTLAQYNIAPPVSLLIQDQKQQAKQFETYRKNLTSLRKRGVPRAMLDELQSLGPQGRLDVQSMAGASKAQIAVLIQTWKQKKGDIQSATSIDYKNKLKEYRSYGKQVMLQILEGLKSQSDWLGKGFTKYVLTDALGKSFTKWVNNMFPNIIKDAGIKAGVAFDKKAAADAKARAAAGGGTGSGTGGTTPTPKVPVVKIPKVTGPIADEQTALTRSQKLLKTLIAHGQTQQAVKVRERIVAEKVNLNRLSNNMKPVSENAIIMQEELISAQKKTVALEVKMGNKQQAAMARALLRREQKQLYLIEHPETAGTGWPKNLPPAGPPKKPVPPYKKDTRSLQGIVNHNHTELHVHGTATESLHAAGRRLLFEYQTGVRRSALMGHQ
jgi:hypothetical protein